MKHGRWSQLLICGLVAFLGCPGVTWAAEANFPNDPFFAQLWYLPKIQAPQAWNTTYGFEGVTVAIIDSGVDINHPELQNNIWSNVKEIPNNGIDDDGDGLVDDINGWNFVANNNNVGPNVAGRGPVLFANHGTVVAGIMAAQGDNKMGTVGVTWQTKIMSIRALDEFGAGDPTIVAKAVDYAVAHGAKVINLSFVSNKYDYKLNVALRHAYESGVVVVAAAGNAPAGKPAINFSKKSIYPVCFDKGGNKNYVIGVAATDENDQKASFSNYGKNCVDISAPGTRVVAPQNYLPGSLNFSEAYGGYYQGTSIAAPIVSAVVALIFSIRSDLTPDQILYALKTSADPVNLQSLPIGSMGAGRINAARALQIAQVMPTVQRVKTILPTRALIPKVFSPRLVATAPLGFHLPEVSLFTDTGTYVRSFLVFDKNFRGGVSLAGIKIDSSRGFNSFVVGEANNGTGKIKVYNLDGLLVQEFMAYEAKFKGGISLASADVNGDGRDDVLVVPNSDSNSEVRIYSVEGILIKKFVTFPKTVEGGFKITTKIGPGQRLQIVVTSNKIGEARTFSTDGGLLSIQSIQDAPKFDDVVTISLKNRRPQVSLKLLGATILQFFVFEPTYFGDAAAIILDDRGN